MFVQPAPDKVTDPDPHRVNEELVGEAGFGRMTKSSVLSPKVPGSGVDATTLSR
jgi:hypothetical protein